MVEAEIAPPFITGKALGAMYWRLYDGVRNEEDPVSVRTLLIDSGTLVGLKKPEKETVPEVNWEKASELLQTLTADTHLAALVPEYLSAMGVAVEKDQPPISLLVVNGRHKAEPLWAGLAGYTAKKLGKDSVAAFNPVGHYRDKQSRVAGIPKLLRHVDQLAVVASTQTAKGGSLSLLSEVLRLMRNPDFAMHIGTLNIIIPMFGGSRGHRLGQRKGLVYEVMETVASPKYLVLPLFDVMFKVWREQMGKDLLVEKNPMAFLKHLAGFGFPKIRFLTVDIHNDELPGRKFKEMGFKFESIDPSMEFAQETLKVLRERKLPKLLRIIACDEGSIPRTERFAARMFGLLPRSVKIEVVYVDKKRTKAGVVDSATIGKICRVVKKRKEILFPEVNLSRYNWKKPATHITNDDMADTVNTARTDDQMISSVFPKISRKIFVATHAILSKGLKPLDRLGADVYLFGNTLQPNGLAKRKDVRIVDVSPAIYRKIFEK